ncbi:unnamed protein product [Trypanosoma congolense IL3000]|uniref:WGS project CAEQ00000000 data, annotated contig 491 n=1 Tax=Trypanosoma congolense (strain IL3000) TaxID=1068625 RepID=F9WGD4_TRYCI|nr:unnamed protein product [Trypanosoma congolense IL3000]
MFPHPRPLGAPVDLGNCAPVAPFDMSWPEHPWMEGEEGLMVGSVGHRRKSFCGPRTEEEWEELMARRECARTESGHGRGSVQMGVGGTALGSGVSTPNDSGCEVLRDYYGDMAGRDGSARRSSQNSMGGRRVLGGRTASMSRSNASRERSSYGSLSSRRQKVMEEGGKWGNNPEEYLPANPTDLMDAAHSLFGGMYEGMEGPQEVCVLRQTDTKLYDTGRAFDTGKGA